MALPSAPNATFLNLPTGMTVVKPNPGICFTITVSASGGGTIGIYDSATPTPAGVAGQQFFTVPASAAAGTIYALNWPCAVGIVVSGTATAGTISIAFS